MSALANHAFAKMNGIGNEIVVIDLRDKPAVVSAEEARAIASPAGVPFDQPEHEVFTWDVALNADELIGLLGTFSWLITMPEETRRGVIAEARRLLKELLGVEGDVTVDVAFRADAYRSRRHDRA